MRPDEPHVVLVLNRLHVARTSLPRPEIHNVCVIWVEFELFLWGQLPSDFQDTRQVKAQFWQHKLLTPSHLLVVFLSDINESAKRPTTHCCLFDVFAPRQAFSRILFVNNLLRCEKVVLHDSVELFELDCSKHRLTTKQDNEPTSNTTFRKKFLVIVVARISQRHKCRTGEKVRKKAHHRSNCPRSRRNLVDASCSRSTSLVPCLTLTISSVRQWRVTDVSFAGLGESCTNKVVNV